MQYRFADLIIPTPLAQLFTYEVPVDMELSVGMRVIVSFGKRHFYTGIVAKLHNEKPDFDVIKPIDRVLDTEPLVTPLQIELWQILAKYYHTTIGEVYQAAVPQVFRLESETKLTLTNQFFDTETLTPKEAKICSMLTENPNVTAKALNTLCGGGYLADIERLREAEIILSEEDLDDDFKPKTKAFVSSQIPLTEESIKKALDTLNRSKKQQAVFRIFADLTKSMAEKRMEKALLQDLANCTNQQIVQLEQKGLLKIEHKVVNRLEKATGKTIAPKQLSQAQTKALQEIQTHWQEKQTVLLHGVTGSGKTEIYIHLIQQALERQQQVLLLVPEIALSTQLAHRLQQVFGDALGVYHSRYSGNERAEIWNHVLHNTRYKVILGTRSSIFLPYQNLGLIIVDEEHDPSYKQQEPAPRYSGRNAALMLSRLTNCKVLLGSATPSVETYCRTQQQKYALVELKERHNNTPMPQIEVIDMQQAHNQGMVRGHLSRPLIEAIKATIERGEQVILFQNRRGFAPYTECNLCGWTPKCKRCDVTLTYHKRIGAMRCHYCGSTLTIPTKCPQCGNTRLQMHGAGTEKLEEELQKLFPTARIERMDLDTTSGKHSLQALFERIETHQIDILVGTQMVTKGLDFPGIKLVGIVNADQLMALSDYQASERAFQQLTQVSGRSGRQEPGNVIIQTSQPQHPIIQDVLNQNYGRFFRLQLSERQLFNYPPYCRIVSLTVRHFIEQAAADFSNLLVQTLKQRLNGTILGPNTPDISRVNNKYIKTILFKLPLTNTEAEKSAIMQTIGQLTKEKAYRGIQCTVDVDPE
ncbi:MAG: primosomal protein N' [Paludibacteraceae bacterium]|nr:primosomal protein N' [Paludibacteraceae bacterium]